MTLCTGLSQDSLFVAAKSGLNLRTEPSLESKVVAKLELNSIIKLDSIFHLDTIANRIGKWVLVKTKENRGFVFDAFLNKAEIPLGKMLFGNYIKEYLVKVYDLNDPVLIERPNYGGKARKMIELFASENCIIHTETGCEWWDMEIILKDWTLNEVLNILENSDCYMNICDYPLAFENRNKNYTEWRTRTDEDFNTKIFEGETGNLQINIHWSF